MIYIGKIDKITLEYFMKPAYQNYRNVNYDLSLTKIRMIQYLIQNNQFIHKYNTRYDDYKLNILSKREFKLNLKNCDEVTYIFCIESGKVSLRY